MTTTSDPTPAAAAAPATTTIRPGAPKESFIKRIIGFAGWIFSGFGLLTRYRSNAHMKSEEVVLYAVHQSFFLWALVLVGFIGAFWVGHWPGSAVVWGWLYLWTLLYTLVTVIYDMSTLKFLLWVGIFSFLWLISRYLEDVRAIPILTQLGAYLRNLHPRLDHGFAMFMSAVLLPAWIGSLFQTFSRGRKIFSPNSIEEWYIAEGSEITDRSGLKFRTRYRDIFETALGLGAGDLEAIDGNGHVVKSWPNILFLAFTWPKLDEILHQRAATVDNAVQDPVEVENVRGNAAGR
jgi:hypothetical protein